MTHTNHPQRAVASGRPSASSSSSSSSSLSSVRARLDARPACLRFRFVAHERALEAVGLLQPALLVIRRKSRSLFSQLDSALDNVVGNVAEGDGKVGGHRRQSFLVTLGEAREARGRLATAYVKGYVSLDEVVPGAEKLREVERILGRFV